MTHLGLPAALGCADLLIKRAECSFRVYFFASTYFASRLQKLSKACSAVKYNIWKGIKKIKPSAFRLWPLAIQII